MDSRDGTEVSKSYKEGDTQVSADLYKLTSNENSVYDSS